MLSKRKIPAAAFTLVELLVVIAIIGVLVALLLPAIQAAREAARRSQCINQAKQWTLALHNYESSLRKLPPGVIRDNDGGESAWKTLGYSWIAHILPYVEAANLNERIDFDLNVFNKKRLTPIDVQLDLARCPSDDVQEKDEEDEAGTNYVVSYGSGITLNGDGTQTYGSAYPASNNNPVPPDGPFYINSETRLARVADGTSNTVAVSECLIGRPLINRNTGSPPFPCMASTGDKKDRGESWMFGLRIQSWGFTTLLVPNDKSNPNGPIECEQYSGRGVYAARSDHPGGVNVSMLDGSVRFVNDSVDPVPWLAVGSIDKGEVVDGSF